MLGRILHKKVKKGNKVRKCNVLKKNMEVKSDSYYLSNDIFYNFSLTQLNII